MVVQCVLRFDRQIWCGQSREIVFGNHSKKRKADQRLFENPILFTSLSDLHHYHYHYMVLTTFLFTSCFCPHSSTSKEFFDLKSNSFSVFPLDFLGLLCYVSSPLQINKYEKLNEKEDYCALDIYSIQTYIVALGNERTLVLYVCLMYILF